AVEVHSRNHIELVRTGQHLLQGNVGNRVLDEDPAGSFRRVHLRVRLRLALRALDAVPLLPREYVIRELALGQLIAPIAERALGKFHDVALVHNRHALALVVDRVLQRGAEQPVGAFLGRGFEADSGTFRKANLGELLRKVLLEQIQEFLGVGRPRLELDSRIDVFGVLAENDHVDLFRRLDRRRHALEPAHRAQADVQVQQLAQCHVQRTDAAADRSGERPLDRHQVVAAGGHRFIGQPGVVGLVGLFSREHLHPANLALRAVRLEHRRVEHSHARAPDVAPGPIALDEGHDGPIRYVQLAVGGGYFLAPRGDLHGDRLCFEHLAAPINSRSMLACAARRLVLRTLTSTPAKDGFRMPAEFERHSGCWMLWPERPDNWREGAKPAQAVFAAIATAIAGGEPVTVGVSAAQFQNARARLPPRVRVVEISSNDAWIRDCGPSFVIDAKGRRRGVDWTFNAWGGLAGGLYFPWDRDDEVARKVLEIEGADRYRTRFVLEGGAIHVDGQGTCMTTEECLLNPNRNADMTRADIEEALRRYLGVSTVLWLGAGVYLDETGGH